MSCLGSIFCLPLHCWDSTCNLLPRTAYAPAHHGYYYYRPYNYQHVLAHQETPIGAESHAPYTTTVFDLIYDELLTDAEKQPQRGTPGIEALPGRSNALPNLEDILKGSQD